MVGMRPDPEVQAHSARQAAEHQRAVVPGLSDERLREVAARLQADGDDSVINARLAVVFDELSRRERERQRTGEDAAAR